MAKWWKKIWCLHFWIRTGKIYGLDDQWICTECGKKTWVECNDIPLSGVIKDKR